MDQAPAFNKQDQSIFLVADCTNPEIAVNCGICRRYAGGAEDK